MSADFEIAVAFGATHVRVGSQIFGGRTAQPFAVKRDLLWPAFGARNESRAGTLRTWSNGQSTRGGRAPTYGTHSFFPPGSTQPLACPMAVLTSPRLIRAIPSSRARRSSRGAAIHGRRKQDDDRRARGRRRGRRGGARGQGRRAGARRRRESAACDRHQGGKAAKTSVKTQWAEFIVDVWITNFNSIEFGIYKRSRNRAKSRQFSSDMDIFAEVIENGDRTGLLGYREDLWKKSTGMDKRLVFKLFTDS